MSARSVIGTVCMMTLALAGAGCQKQNQLVAPPPPTVTVAVPLEQPVQEYFETTGQTRAAQRVELRARVSGYLKQINFKDGEQVNEGRLLFQIDQAPYIAIVNSAKAALARAEAQFRLSERQLERTKSLAVRQAATESNLDVQQAELDSASADVSSARAALDTAELNLRYTEINAPFTGRIGRHMVDAGNIVRSEETILAPLSAVDPMHAYFHVSEADHVRFLQMQRDKIINISETNPLPVEMSMGESDDFEFQGKLDFREFGIDPQTGTTQRRAIFDNPESRLVPGMFVRLRTPLGAPQPKLLVEERAIGSGQQGDFLLVVNEKNIVEMRNVKLGLAHHGLRAIESGLRKGDRVVINGLQRARPGAEVKPDLAIMGAALVPPSQAPADPKSEAKPQAEEKPAADKPPVQNPPADKPKSE